MLSDTKMTLTTTIYILALAIIGSYYHVLLEF